MQKKANKSGKSSTQNDELKKKRKAILILLSIYLLLSMIIIFFRQKMSPGVFLCFVVPPVLLSFVIAMIAVEIDSSSKARKFFSVIKICLIITVLIIFTLGGQVWYKNLQLEKYRKLTAGIVTNVTYEYSSKYSTATYYVEVRFNADNVVKNDYTTYSYNKYDKGDSVKIAYSYKDPDFWKIDDGEN